MEICRIASVATFSIASRGPRGRGGRGGGRFEVSCSRRGRSMGERRRPARSPRRPMPTRAPGPRGLAMMRDGPFAGGCAPTGFLADDPDSSTMRQARARGHEREICRPYRVQRVPAWAGHIVGPSLRLSGNIISGPRNRRGDGPAHSGASTGPAGRPAPCTALAAGERAGGVRRGRQSAALYVARDQGRLSRAPTTCSPISGSTTAVDPVGELARPARAPASLLRIEPAGTTSSRSRASCFCELQAMMAGTGQLRSSPPSGIWDKRNRTRPRSLRRRGEPGRTRRPRRPHHRRAGARVSALEVWCRVGKAKRYHALPRRVGTLRFAHPTVASSSTAPSRDRAHSLRASPGSVPVRSCGR